TILDGRPNWFSSMLNWAWIIMLLLPLLPVVGRLSAVILPIQAAALAALLFTWLAEFRGLQEFSYWPGGSAVTSMLVIAITGHFAAAWTAGLLAGRSDRADWHESIYDTVVLIFQAPAILIYTHSLGAQLL
ncbi:MAG: hypothetical protein MJA83_06240, partial [Gammaproteobacteria bacterium]|nr:hypothetical protein [Gammaproteobacteria bacterium]